MANFLTIYTDASVCMETFTAGWAAWIKNAPGDHALFSGVFKSIISDTTEAELRAIGNGIACAVKAYAPKKTIIVVVTDSQGALDIMNGTAPKWKKPLRKNHLSDKAFEAKMVRYHRRMAYVEIGEIIKKYIPECCELRVNKVKGHSHHDGARSYVNRLVDKAARREMRKAREKKA